jgi:hypothetical protein
VIASLAVIAILATISLGGSVGQLVPTGGVAGITGQPSPSPSASTEPSQPVTPSTALPTPAPSPSAIAASPTPGASAAALAVVATAVRPWPEQGGGRGAQVIAAVENRTSTAIRLVATDSSYRLLAGGQPVLGRFLYALPNAIDPGERGYLIDVVDLASGIRGPSPILEVALGEGGALDRPLERLEVRDVTWTAGSAGLWVRGSVTNTLGSPVLQGVVGAVALDAGDRPLAGVVDLTELSPLGPDETRAFDLAEPPTGPIDPATIARLEVFAFDLEG